MTAKIYNCEALFLARMQNTLLNNNREAFELLRNYSIEETIDK